MTGTALVTQCSTLKGYQLSWISASATSCWVTHNQWRPLPFHHFGVQDRHPFRSVNAKRKFYFSTILKMTLTIHNRRQIQNYRIFRSEETPTNMSFRCQKTRTRNYGKSYGPRSKVMFTSHDMPLRNIVCACSFWLWMSWTYSSATCRQPSKNSVLSSSYPHRASESIVWKSRAVYILPLLRTSGWRTEFIPSGRDWRNGKCKGTKTSQLVLKTKRNWLSIADIF